jgi:23S rRNA pseudouridine1911/1915/1917 synthase
MMKPPREQRLARRLQEVIGSTYSRAKREVLIGHATVDGAVVTDPGHVLRPNAVVAHQPGLPRRSPVPRGPGIEILHVDEDLVVVNKPSGVLVHPTSDGEEDTVLARLVVELARRFGNPRKVKVVHRLDRDTSGVMVLARSHAAAEHLQRQFRAHSVSRRYRALVAGDIEREVLVERGIARPRPGARRAAFVLGGKPARTTIRPLERFGSVTLVEAELGTGRTHQVRVHLSSLGHPVLCDPIYGAEREDPVTVPRLALHAAHLGLIHPRTGEPLEFDAPLPADLAGVVTAIRRRALTASRSHLPAQPAPPRRRQNEAARKPPPLRTRRRRGEAPAPPPADSESRRRRATARRPRRDPRR